MPGGPARVRQRIGTPRFSKGLSALAIPSVTDWLELGLMTMSDLKLETVSFMPLPLLCLCLPGWRCLVDRVCSRFQADPASAPARGAREVALGRQRLAA